MKVTVGDSRIDVTGDGRIASFSIGKRSLRIGYSTFLVAGSILESQDFTTVADGKLMFSAPERKGASTTPAVSGTICVGDDGGRFAISADIDETPSKGDTVVDLGVALHFDLSAKIHLAEPFNVVRLLDEEMPVGREYSTKAGPNLCIVETKSVCVALWSNDGTTFQRLNEATRTVSRHSDRLSLRFTVPATQRIIASVHTSLDDALGAFRSWMVKDLGLAPRGARPDSPVWVDDVQLFFTVDMLRSTGEITHDYPDLEHLADDLAEVGCPKDTVFYIPGWNGPYDAAYPDYRPRVELGGDRAFRSMMDTVHRHGYRVMIHTNPWGLDPFHPQIDDLLKYAVKDKAGRYAGFQTHSATKWGQWAPKYRTLDFATGLVPLSLSGSGQQRVFTVHGVPDHCEAVVSIGGMPNFDGRVSIQFDERLVRSPQGWFADENEFTFPFALRLHPGANQIRIDGPAEALEADGTWFRVHDCRVPVDPYSTWTYPILFGDTENDEWNQLVIGNIGETVDRYGIDAIHCDATNFVSNSKYYEALRKRLPTTAIGAEGYSALSSLGYFEFSQSHHNMSLTQYADTYTGTVFQGSLPDWSALDDALAYLNKPSPLVGFTDEFIRLYPHLCAADAFVPVGKVCTCSDPVKSPRETRRLRQILDDAPRLNYIPALRVNYREYGLDDETKAYVRSLAGK